MQQPFYGQGQQQQQQPYMQQQPYGGGFNTPGSQNPGYPAQGYNNQGQFPGSQDQFSEQKGTLLLPTGSRFALTFGFLHKKGVVR
jgi:hypothetical protein